MDKCNLTFVWMNDVKYFEWTKTCSEKIVEVTSVKSSWNRNYLFKYTKDYYAGKAGTCKIENKWNQVWQM